MFELIRANKRRSMVLVFAMLLVLLALGFVVGSALFPSAMASEYSDESFRPGFAFDPTAGFIGMGIAFFIWMVQAAIAYTAGDRILLSVSRARPIEKADHPQLYNVVEEMTIAAQLPKPPKVYIIDDMAMNAFATGRKPENAAVAVTAGLLGRLNRDELQGVVAHEIGHIVNRDVLFMTMVSIMLGTIVIIAEVFLRSLWYGSATRRYSSSSSKKGGGAQGVVMVIAIVLAILAPLLAQFIYFACSRRREYLADASAAVYTRYPEGLASALEAISGDSAELASANKATAPMYIVNPFSHGKTMALSLTRTHPPLAERVRILRSMAGGASFAAYQTAWSKASVRRAARAMPASALSSEAGGAVRKAHPDAVKQDAAANDPKKRMREAGDLLRNLNQFIFLSCACGMRIKLPPEFKHDKVQCPRCQRSLEVPVAAMATAGVLGDVMAKQGTIPTAAPAAVPQGQAPLEVKRQGKGWQSVKCPCGAVKNIAPSCRTAKTSCSKCGRAILIRG